MPCIALLSILLLAGCGNGGKKRSKSPSSFRKWLQAALEASPNWVGALDADGRMILTNRKGHEITGLSEKGSASVPFTDIWPEDSRPAVRDAISRAARGQRSSFISSTQDSSGRRKTWQVFLSRLPGELENINLIGMVANDITEHVLTRQALAETGETYRLIFESFTDVYVRTDMDGRITAVSSSVRRLTGYEPAEVIGHPIEHFLAYPNDKLTLQSELLQSGSVEDYQISGIAKDGRVFHVSLSARVVQENGGPLCVEGVIRDITERKLAEEALRQSEERFRMLVDRSADAIFLHTRDGRIIDVNRQACDSLGYTREELLLMRVQDLEQSYETREMMPLWQASQDPSSPLTICGAHRRKDGTSFPVEICLGPFECDGQEMILATVRDISERVQAERMLRIQTSAINAATDQVVITDSRGRIEFVNPAFEQETGYTFEEARGRNPGFLKSGNQDDSFYAQLWQTISSGRVWHGEVVNRRKDGSTYAEDMTITPVPGSSSNIDHFIAIKRNITQKKIYEQHLSHMAHHDPLTGLPNRLLFSDELNHRLARTQKDRLTCGVMFLDLDRFKVINDTLGHNVGDGLLKEVASRLRDCLRQSDLLARMGGDEYTAIVSDIGHPDDAATVARKVLDAFSKSFVVQGHELCVTASIGISLYPMHGQDVETLVRNADTAMYCAKETGRNTFRFYSDDFNAGAMGLIALESAFRKALSRGQFVAHYQPRVGLGDWQIRGVEALLRWEHPKLGLLMPSYFMPMAEETGIITKISQWILRNACMQNKEWQDRGFAHLQMAVNVSAIELENEEFIDYVESALNESGLDPRSLELEVTENTLMRKSKLAARVLRKLKAIGVNVSIDDFGTGYSSLPHIKELDVDAVKIDRSLVCDLNINPSAASIVRAIVAMAHGLGLRVAAEGVETIEQLEFLRSIGCDEIQGYFIARPVPAEDLFLLLTHQTDDPSTIYRAA